MYLLIEYTGEIKVNQVGINYNFPHYSTILGAILGCYHYCMKTPQFPRKDMFELANELGIELVLLVNDNNNNQLLLEYTQLRNMEKKVKDDGNIYSPANKFIIKGKYYILIKTENNDLIRSLTQHQIKIGSNDSTLVEYCFSVYSDKQSFLEKYDKKGFVFLHMDDKYTLASQFSSDLMEICVVSQIQRNNCRLYAQGVYSDSEWRKLDSDFSFDLLSYNRLYTETMNEINQYIDCINGNEIEGDDNEN